MEYRIYWNTPVLIFIYTVIIFAQLGFVCILEQKLRNICARIRSPKYRAVFGWSMFALIRLVVCDSLNCTMECSTRHSLIFANFANESIVDAAICDSIYIAFYAAFGLIVWISFRAVDETAKRCSVWQEKLQSRQRQQISIWLRGKRLQFDHRHQSVDLISLVHSLICGSFYSDGIFYYDLLTPCKVRFYSMTMFDCDITDDPVSPEVSLVRSVMVFVCDKCKKDNGVYLIETSLLRRESRFTMMRPLDNTISREEFDQMQFSAFQSAGVVITHVTGGPNGQETWFYNLRLREEALVQKWPTDILLDSDTVCYFVHDKKRARNLVAMHFFAGFLREDSTPTVSFSFRHCVFEVSFLLQAIRVGTMPNFHGCFPQPWRLHDHRLFQSPGRVGVIVEMVSAFGGLLTRCIAFERANGRLSSALYLEYLLMDDPFRCYTARYFREFEEETEVPCPEVFSASEAMSVQGDGTISRYKIKAASLKWSCLEKIFDIYEDDVKGVSAKKNWLQIIGVPLDGHYSHS